MLSGISVIIYFLKTLCVCIYFLRKKQPKNRQQLAQLFIGLHRILPCFPPVHVEVYIMLEAAEMWKNSCLRRLACQVTKVKYTGEELRSCFYKTLKILDSIFYIGLKRITFKVIYGLC